MLNYIINFKLVFFALILIVSFGNMGGCNGEDGENLLGAGSSHTITFVNDCDETIWVGAIGNPVSTKCTENNQCNTSNQFCNTAVHRCHFINPNGGGWEMDKSGPTKTVTVFIPIGWSGRYWPRTGCNFESSGKCVTQSPDCCKTGACLENDSKTFGLKCGFSGHPNVPLTEPTFDAPSSFGPYDTYDVSFVDAFKINYTITPQPPFNKKPDPGIDPAIWCTTAGCNTKPKCPQELLLSDGTCEGPCQFVTNEMKPDEERAKICCVCSAAVSIACGSTECEELKGFGCSPVNQNCPDPTNPICDQICDPDGKKRPDATWDTEFQEYITDVHDSCPRVYAWQFDDVKGTFQCRKTGGIVNYKVTFCGQ